MIGIRTRHMATIMTEQAIWSIIPIARIMREIIPEATITLILNVTHFLARLPQELIYHQGLIRQKHFPEKRCAKVLERNRKSPWRSDTVNIVPRAGNTNSVITDKLIFILRATNYGLCVIQDIMQAFFPANAHLKTPSFLRAP
jgi:hypothetical protein